MLHEPKRDSRWFFRRTRALQTRRLKIPVRPPTRFRPAMFAPRRQPILVGGPSMRTGRATLTDDPGELDVPSHDLCEETKPSTPVMMITRGLQSSTIFLRTVRLARTRAAFMSFRSELQAGVRNGSQTRRSRAARLPAIVTSGWHRACRPAWRAPLIRDKCAWASTRWWSVTGPGRLCRISDGGGRCRPATD
jgi:hypothetical protein